MLRSPADIDCRVTVPDGRFGTCAVETFVVSPEDAAAMNALLMRHLPPSAGVRAGTYKRLMVEGRLWMSNTQREIWTNLPLLTRACGRVFVTGLGLGMVVEALLRFPEVSEITVVEKNPDVFTLVGRHFRAIPRLRLILGDALEYVPDDPAPFDFCWHDIWQFYDPRNLEAMNAIEKKYAPYARWQGCWSKEICEQLLRAPKRGLADPMATC